MSSVMITLGLSDDDLSDGGLSDSMVIKSERIDGTLPRGLLILTLGLAPDGRNCRNDGGCPSQNE